MALIAEQPFALIARKDLPADGLQEFIAYAKANETKMQYGSAGAGSATHLGGALLDTAIGIKARHVPYDGGAPALRDLVDGRIDYFCPVVTIAIPQIEKKSVKAIAILSRNSRADLANVSPAPRSRACPTSPPAHGSPSFSRRHARAHRPLPARRHHDNDGDPRPCRHGSRT